MDVFISPAARSNIRETIENVVNWSILQECLTSEEYDRLINNFGLKDGLHCWAAKSSTKIYWKQMKVGDEVLIAENDTNEFRFLANVSEKIQSEALGNRLWPEGDKDKPWEYIYFLSNITAINLRQNIIFPMMGYPNQTFTKGLQILRKFPQSKIGKEFGSVRKYLKSELQKTPTQVQSFEVPELQQTDVSISEPEWLKTVIQEVKLLKKEPQHQERAHEDLVQSLFLALGFEKHTEIKYQVGRMDVSVEVDCKPLIVIEVKRDWSLNRQNRKVVDQAYRYGHRIGARLVAITNGDYYALYNRLKGFSIDDNYLGEFQLSQLDKNGLSILTNLSKQSLMTERISNAYNLESDDKDLLKKERSLISALQLKNNDFFSWLTRVFRELFS